MAEVVTSAPGKVLMTGGYLILERPNAGLVLSTNARFYAIIKPIHHEIKPDSWAWPRTDIRLTSPQLCRQALYKLALKNLAIQTVSPSDARNPFVEYAIQYSVAAAYATFDQNKKELLHKLFLHGLDITILGGNDFYSYRNEIERRGLDSLRHRNRWPPFCLFPPLPSILMMSMGVANLKWQKLVWAHLQQ